MARNIFGVPKNVSDGLVVQEESERSVEKKPIEAQGNGEKEKQTGAAYARYTSAVDLYSKLIVEEEELKSEINRKETDVKTATAKKTQLENNRSTLQKEQNQFHDDAVSRVKRNDLKMQEARKKELSRRMEALKQQCSDEKQKRYDQLQEKKQANKKWEGELKRQEEELNQQINQLTSQKERIDSGNIEVFDDAEYRSVRPIIECVRNRLDYKGWNFVQMKLMSEPVEELAEFVNFDKENAFELVRSLKYSDFYKKIDVPKVKEDQEFNRAVRGCIQGIFLVIFLLGILLSSAFEIHGIRNLSLGMVEAGLTWLILSTLLKFIGLKANDSVLGIIIWVLSFFIGKISAGNMAKYVLGDAPLLGLIILAVLASFVPGMVVKHRYIRILIAKLPFMEGLSVKYAARNADKLEKNAIRQGKQTLKSQFDYLKTDHAISVMICCAMRLDELYSCVCRSEIEAMKTELEHKLENAKQSLGRLSVGRENLEKAQKDIQSQEQVNEYLDKEADTRLKQDLLQLEAESGKSTEIDYEANISETDKARLRDYDRKIKAVTDDIGRSVKQYEEAQKKLREASGRLEVQQNKIQETIDVITGCSQTAGLEDTRDCNGIVHADFYGDICLENKDPKVRPFMVEHHTHPILFSCSEWSSERAIELIYRLWQGFRKRNIEDLLDMYIVDPDGLIANDIMMDTNHYDLLAGVRNGFAGGDQEKKYLRVLSGQKDIEELEKKIQNQQNSLHHYVAENGQRFAAASQSGRGEMIDLVNQMRKDEKGVSIFPYIIAFILVPQDDAQFAAELPDTMLQRISRDNGYKCGFIPVLIAKEEHINRKWTWIDSCECLMKQKYSVDLTSVDLKRG